VRTRDRGLHKGDRDQPLSADAYFRRGIVYRAKGDNDRAGADYSKAIEINPRKHSYSIARVGAL
jgi:Tfp pilus assembly protein PilF